MSYACAVWLAVQEDSYRASEPIPNILTSDSNSTSISTSISNSNSIITSISNSISTDPRTTEHLSNQPISRLDIFDDYFLAQCFHMTRQCVTFIVDCVKARMKKDVFRPCRDATSIESQTLAALYFYAHGFLPRKITDALGLEHERASDAVSIVSKVLEDMCPDFITFPGTYDDRMGVAQGFKYISGIPNVVGVLNWLHVHVTPSPAEESVFLNTRGYYSVMVQIISDVDGNLLSVEQCCPGGTQEQAVWESSNICQEFTRLQHGHTWVLGGKGLSKAKFVLSPVKGSRIKADAARRFNSSHSQVWKSSQHVLGCLKTRFRCLHNLGAVLVDNLKPVARIVNACCVLHNISKKFSVPLPNKLEHLHQYTEMRQEEEENFVDPEEAIEDMIEMCFGNSRNKEEQERKNTKDIEKSHKQNVHNSHKNIS